MRASMCSIVCVVLMTWSLGASATPPAGGQSSGGGGRTGYSGGPGSDPLRFRQLTMNGVREKLGVDEEQWKSLWPKIEKVMEAQQNARTGAGMSFTSGTMVKGTPPANSAVGGAGQRGQSGGGGPGPGAPGSVANVDTPAGRAMQMIRAALEQAAGEEELLERVAAMRVARDAARAELVAAQKELHDACTPRQEAVLLTMGLLE